MYGAVTINWRPPRIFYPCQLTLALGINLSQPGRQAQQAQVREQGLPG